MADRDTVEVYEREAARWTASRAPRQRADAEAFAARASGPCVDLGCGPGWYATALPRPVVALDASLAMLLEAGRRAPGSLRVQGDLEALPVRGSALASAWASRSYVHVARRAMPMALADLHRALRPGAPVELRLFGGDQELAPFADDDFPGRRFSQWDETHLRDVVVGAGFDHASIDRHTSPRGSVELVVRAVRARTLADSVAPGMRLLVCGLNPSVFSADRGVGYARPGNRFWPAAMAAGLVSRDRDPVHALRHHGVGITDLVKRATVAASDLTSAEYRAGLGRVERLCAWLRPGALVLVGLAGWRAAADRRARPGWQARPLGGTPVYVMPSTSGLNARTSLSELRDHLQAAAAGPPRAATGRRG